MKGTIALDIDGTITNDAHQIPDDVRVYFESLSNLGWTFVFLTGRPYSFALKTLSSLTIPFYLGVQNGAVLFDIPSQKEIFRTYLQPQDLQEIEKQFRDVGEGFLLSAGYELQDRCFYKPDHFSKEIQGYFHHLEKVAEVPWSPVQDFSHFSEKSFPLIKGFGKKEAMERLDKNLQKEKNLHATLIKDPFADEIYLILVTANEANKGSALRKLIEMRQLPTPLITGGNDRNDLPLLSLGDERIAMEGSPSSLIELSTLVAPSSDKSGIIQGLQRAIKSHA